jgi:ribonuclease J
MTKASKKTNAKVQTKAKSQEIVRHDNVPDFPADSVSFVALGGCGEFGNNFHVLHHNGEYLLIDCGFGFADDRFPGIDIVLPSPAFLPQVTDKIKGLVFTHAHEDHIGAIGALWPQLNCPIYATPLTARLLQNKFKEWDIERRVQLNIVPLESRHKIGSFDVEWINASHSVPETSMLFIRTEAGNVLHTADWRIDETPVVGHGTNLDKLAQIATEGVDVLIGDSTNALDEGTLPSEDEMRDALAAQMKKAKGAVVISCFSSHIARMHNIAVAAQKSGRLVGLLGRSLWRMYDAARECGYLHDIAPFLSAKELADVPRKQLVIIATGSQGERGAALDRLARRDHNDYEFLNDDTVIFSSRNIPGNEKDILRIQGWLVRQGVNVITKDDAVVHVSGHGTAADMRRVYNIVKPKAVLPVHGDILNQLTHGEVARSCGVDTIVIPHNGDVIAVDRTQGAGVVDHIQTGIMAVDGDRVVPITDSKLFKQRQKIGQEGHVVATIIIDDHHDLVSDPILTLQGVVGDEEEQVWLEGLLDKVIEKTLRQLDKKSNYHTEIWEETIRVAIRHMLNDELGKKPVINVQLVRI